MKAGRRDDDEQHLERQAPPGERDDGERYQLSRLGRSLGEAIAPLDDWARTWARATR